MDFLQSLMPSAHAQSAASGSGAYPSVVGVSSLVAPSAVMPGSGPDGEARTALLSGGVGGELELGSIIAGPDRELLMQLNSTLRELDPADRSAGFIKLLDLVREFLVVASPGPSVLAGDGLLEKLDSDVSAGSSVSTGRRRRRSSRKSRAGRVAAAGSQASEASHESVVSMSYLDVIADASTKIGAAEVYGDGYCYLWAVRRSSIDRVAAQLGPNPLFSEVLGTSAALWESFDYLAALRVAVVGDTAHVRSPTERLVVGDTRFLTLCRGFDRLHQCAPGTLGRAVARLLLLAPGPASEVGFRVGASKRDSVQILFRGEKLWRDDEIEWVPSVPWSLGYGLGLLVSSAVHPGKPRLGLSATSFTAEDGAWHTYRRNYLGVYAEVAVPGELAEYTLWARGEYYKLTTMRAVLTVESDKRGVPPIGFQSFDSARVETGSKVDELSADLYRANAVGAPAPRLVETVVSPVVPYFGGSVGEQALVAKFWRVQFGRATGKGEKFRLNLEIHAVLSLPGEFCRVAYCSSDWFSVRGRIPKWYGGAVSDQSLAPLGLIELTGPVLVTRYSLWLPPGQLKWVFSVVDGSGPDLSDHEFTPFSVAVAAFVAVSKVSRGSVSSRDVPSGGLSDVLERRDVVSGFTVELHRGELVGVVLGGMAP